MGSNKTIIFTLNACHLHHETRVSRENYRRQTALLSIKLSSLFNRAKVISEPARGFGFVRDTRFLDLQCSQHDFGLKGNKIFYLLTSIIWKNIYTFFHPIFSLVLSTEEPGIVWHTLDRKLGFHFCRQILPQRHKPFCSFNVF